MHYYWIQSLMWSDQALNQMENICGECAAITVFIISIFSLPFVRRSLFETFRFVHLLAIAFVVCNLLLPISVIQTKSIFSPP